KSLIMDKVKGRTCKGRPATVGCKKLLHVDCPRHALSLLLFGKRKQEHTVLVTRIGLVDIDRIVDRKRPGERACAMLPADPSGWFAGRFFFLVLEGDRKRIPRTAKLEVLFFQSGRYQLDLVRRIGLADVHRHAGTDAVKTPKVVIE